eukprot:jgi/Botrbrau1/11859/Bobra.0175s0021.1
MLKCRGTARPVYLKHILAHAPRGPSGAAPHHVFPDTHPRKCPRWPCCNSCWLPTSHTNLLPPAPASATQFPPPNPSPHHPHAALHSDPAVPSTTPPFATSTYLGSSGVKNLHKHVPAHHPQNSNACQCTGSAPPTTIPVNMPYIPQFPAMPPSYTAGPQRWPHSSAPPPPPYSVSTITHIHYRHCASTNWHAPTTYLQALVQVDAGWCLLFQPELVAATNCSRCIHCQHGTCTTPADPQISRYAQQQPSPTIHPANPNVPSSLRPAQLALPSTWTSCNMLLNATAQPNHIRTKGTGENPEDAPTPNRNRRRLRHRHPRREENALKLSRGTPQGTIQPHQHSTASRTDPHAEPIHIQAFHAVHTSEEADTRPLPGPKNRHLPSPSPRTKTTEATTPLKSCPPTEPAPRKSTVMKYI